MLVNNHINKYFKIYIQVKETAKRVFGQRVEIALKKQEVVFDTVICSFMLTFDNSAYTEITEAFLKRKEASLPIRASVLFEMFPFCILFQVTIKVF